MSILEMFRRKKTSAPVARERLQIILAHERSATSTSDILVTLREEILQVIAKHMTIDRDKVRVSMDRGDDVSLLEVDVELVLAVDVSPANDWSQVRVWYAPLGKVGKTAWPVEGFIYSDRGPQQPRVQYAMAPARKQTSKRFLSAFAAYAD